MNVKSITFTKEIQPDFKMGLFGFNIVLHILSKINDDDHYFNLIAGMS